MNTQIPTNTQFSPAKYAPQLDIALSNALERVGFEHLPAAQFESAAPLQFVQLSSICYERSQQTNDLPLIDFATFLSALGASGGEFAYVIEGSAQGLRLFLGAPDAALLQKTFKSFYGGSELKAERLGANTHKFSAQMLGIPSLKRASDKEYKQSLEKLLRPFLGKNFRVCIYAKSLAIGEIKDILARFYELSSELASLVKCSRNVSQTQSHGSSESATLGSSQSQSKSASTSSSHTASASSKSDTEMKRGLLITAGKGALSVAGGIVGAMIAGPAGAAAGAAAAGMAGGMLDNFARNETQSSSEAKSKSHSFSESFSTNESRTSSTNKSTSRALSFGTEEINKTAAQLEKMADKHIERYYKGLSSAMWQTAVSFAADDESTLAALCANAKAVFSGDESFYEPIRFARSNKSNLLGFYKMDFAHAISDKLATHASILHTEELAILSALPQNDLPGISVRKISNYGLNASDKSGIEIGEICDKFEPIGERFRLSLNSLNSHTFISGITGSGKSNSVKNILLKLHEQNLPFLIIEPAKSEYKDLISQIPNLQIFRPGFKGDVFKLNPFVFEYSPDEKSITLSHHVDMLKAAFGSAFAMYGPMPFMLEEAINKAYEAKGWDFISEENPYYTVAKSADVYKKSELFPNMSDVLVQIEKVLARSDYAGEVHSNIKAALQTRVKNLTLGLKGKIFNSRWAISAKELFSKPTVIELSNLANDEEKAFLMGLILNLLSEYRCAAGASSELKHICVIEEAHRLLPNISASKSEESSNAKGKAVEVFVNLLAEIRSYGQGFIIADQVASKLHPDVIKNTNIKIIQRTMAMDDRELVGGAINLNKEQILDIAELKIGQAIVHNKDLHQPFLVQIDKAENFSCTQEQIEGFYKKFLGEFEHLKYEFIAEKNYFIPPEKRAKFLTKANPDELQIAAINLINALAFKEGIKSSWQQFCAALNCQFYDMDENIYMYLFLMAWGKFKHINQANNYSNVDEFLQAQKDLLKRINYLIKNDFDKAASGDLKLISKQIDEFETQIDCSLLSAEFMRITKEKK